MKAFIIKIKAIADTFRTLCAREKELMETYGFSVITSGGNAKDGVLIATQKSGSTVPLPEGEEGKNLVKEWKTLSAKLKVVRAFQSQEDITVGNLRHLAEALETAILADEARNAPAVAAMAPERNKLAKNGEKVPALQG